MRVDELEQALGNLALAQPPVDDGLKQIRDRARRCRRGRLVAGACVVAVLIVAAGLWFPVRGHRSVDVTVGPPQSALSVTSTTELANLSDRLVCPGNATTLEISPVDGGAPTPDQEIPSFLSTAPVGVPSGNYVPDVGPDGGGPSGSSVDQQAYVHRSSSGTVDGRLTLIRLTSGWRVDSASWCQ